jgi:hypothetical protein
VNPSKDLVIVSGEGFTFDQLKAAIEKAGYKAEQKK